MSDRLRDIIEYANEIASLRTTSRNDTPERRFWEQVDTSGDCWVWKGYTLPNGYGSISINGKHVFVHRFSYSLHFGKIPDELCVCHRCDNPPCVRPDHLWLGTQQDNIADRNRKGRTHRGPRKSTHETA